MGTNGNGSNGRRLCGRPTVRGTACTRPVIRIQSGPIILHGTVCEDHDKSGRQRKRLINKANELRFDQTTKRTVRRMGQPVKIDPGDALLREVEYAAGDVAYLRQQCQNLTVPTDPEWSTFDDSTALELVDDITHTRAPLFGPNHLGNLEPHVIWRMYREACDYLIKVCTKAIEHGVMERERRINDTLAQIFIRVLTLIVDDAELDLPAAKRAIARTRAVELMEIHRGEVIQAALPN